jgi:hypothetical protein
MIKEVQLVGNQCYTESNLLTVVLKTPTRKRIIEFQLHHAIVSVKM